MLATDRPPAGGEHQVLGPGALRTYRGVSMTVAARLGFLYVSFRAWSGEGNEAQSSVKNVALIFGGGPFSLGLPNRPWDQIQMQVVCLGWTIPGNQTEEEEKESS